MVNKLINNTDCIKGLNNQHFFSIIIATYNRANLLKRALNSLILQTEEDWEAIIIDDGSTDDTFNQVKPYLKQYPKIKYIKKEHNGEAISKNEGIWLSGGRFISFLDSDDEFNPRHLEYRKYILTKYPFVKFLYGGVKILGNQFVPDRNNYGRGINLNNCVIGGTFFIERNFLVFLNGFRKIYLGTDADLFDRVKETKEPMMETGIPTYIYHHEIPDSITNEFYSGLQPFKE
jgi:glycosyltransferase involved in cell wall biosynthesis